MYNNIDSSLQANLSVGHFSPSKSGRKSSNAVIVWMIQPSFNKIFETNSVKTARGIKLACMAAVGYSSYYHTWERTVTQRGSCAALYRSIGTVVYGVTYSVVLKEICFLMTLNMRDICFPLSSLFTLCSIHPLPIVLSLNFRFHL